MTPSARQTLLSTGSGKSLPAVLLLFLLAAAPPAKADALGRLFFTPEQRAVLDRQRKSGALEKQTEAAATLYINGIVRPSRGSTTVWINGIPQLRSRQHDGESADHGIGWSHSGPGSIIIGRKLSGQ